MSDIIKSRNFDKAKNELKTFSNNLPKATELPTLKTNTGIFGLFNKTVTGKEMNEITKEINKSFISYNNHIHRLIKEFGTIYNTFETLDKEYIQKIIASTNAAETASKQANKASQEALSAQSDIRRIVEVLKQNVAKLGEAKNQTDNEFKNIKKRLQAVEEYLYVIQSSEPMGGGSKLNNSYKDGKHQLENTVKTKISNPFEKKIKIAYWVGGGALFLSVFQLVLRFMGV